MFDKRRQTLVDDDCEKPTRLFHEINQLRRPTSYEKEKIKKQADLAKFSDTTRCGRIARSRYFEYITLGVIIFNALYLGYEADYSARYEKPDDLYSADMPFGFIVMENVFSIFFTVELLIRFFGYVNKMTFAKDLAFLFDFVLVLMMLIETYPLAILSAGGGLSQFSILRLLRLTRILRMGKLLHFFPELFLIVKGMAAAVRAVGCVAILMLMVIYVFAILFTNEYHQGWQYDSELEEDDIAFLFGSLGKSIRHLFIMATIMDDITFCLSAIRSTNQLSMIFVFFVLVGISAFMLFNMLLGILCEVVDATSAGEKVKMKDRDLKETIGSFFSAMDINRDSEITRQEFELMEQHPEIMKALKKLGIQHDNLSRYADLFFNHPDEESRKTAKNKAMQSEECVAMLMKLRPGKGINCCDFNSFRKKLLSRNSRIAKYLDTLEWFVEELGGFDDDDDDDGGEPTSPELSRASSIGTRTTGTGSSRPRRSKRARTSRRSSTARRSSMASEVSPKRSARLSEAGARQRRWSSSPTRHSGTSIPRTRKLRRSLSAFARSPAAEASHAPAKVSRWQNVNSVPSTSRTLKSTEASIDSDTFSDAKLKAFMERRRLKYLQAQEDMVQQVVDRHPGTMMMAIDSDATLLDVVDSVTHVQPFSLDLPSNKKMLAICSNGAAPPLPELHLPDLQQAWQ